MDQLNRARATGAAFQEFQEGPLCFAPTYKYIPGTRELDTRRVLPGSAAPADLLVSSILAAALCVGHPC